MNIAGQSIIVTGAASGLGLAFASRLTQLGATVWGLDRDTEALERAREQFNNPSDEEGAAQFLLCDVSQEAEVAKAIAAIEQAGGANVLINNAAVLRDQTLVAKLGRNIKKHSLSDWQETLASNLTGTFLMAREFAESLIRAKRHGLIINFSSISRNGNPGQSAYAATKAAIDALTVTWSQELAIYGIRVVAIAPGFVETSMTKNIPPLFLDRIRERTPLKRFGELDEFAHAVQFAIENDYLNGKVLELDGGLRF